MKCTEAKLE